MYLPGNPCHLYDGKEHCESCDCLVDLGETLVIMRVV